MLWFCLNPDAGRSCFSGDLDDPRDRLGFAKSHIQATCVEFCKVRVNRLKVIQPCSLNVRACEEHIRAGSNRFELEGVAGAGGYGKTERGGIIPEQQLNRNIRTRWDRGGRVHDT